MEALGEGTPKGTKGPELVGGLDALGDHVDAQPLGHGEDPGDDRGVVVRRREAGDERPVHLEDVDREALEVAERRVTGAEVVDGEAHAERFQPQQVLEGAVAVLHEHALGDLESQRVVVE